MRGRRETAGASDPTGDAEGDLAPPDHVRGGARLDSVREHRHRHDADDPRAVTYLIQYTGHMALTLLTEARERSGLTRAELARRSATSRPTLSAYEHGRVSPTLDTFARVVAATGHRLEVVRVPQWSEVAFGRGRVAHVPDELPRLATHDAVATVELPLHLDWSSRDRSVDLSQRQPRLRAYETILREGRPVDIEQYVDGVLLVDAWDDLVLPRPIRVAWQPVIDQPRRHG